MPSDHLLAFCPMRRLLFILTILFSAYVSAEDIIVTRSSQRISAIIEEVGPDYIKYHSSSNPDGPLFRLEAYEIATVIYGNGDVQTFDAVAPAPAVEYQQLPQPQPGVQPAYGQQPFGYQPYPQQPFVDYKALERMRKDSIRTAKKEAFRAKMDAIPRSHFVLANYSYSFNKSHNVGLTYGWCHAVGFSVNAMLGVSGFHYGAKERIRFMGDYNDYPYQLTNEHTRQRISITPGLLVRLGCPLYLNIGFGYVYSTLTFKSTNGDWVNWGWKEYDHKMNPQIGLIGNIKGVSVMAAYSGYFSSDCDALTSEVMIGLGFALSNKKGGIR